jgi:hypothetical protein
MSYLENLPLPECNDPDELSMEERETYIRYWASRTLSERLREVQRLRIAKWGDAARAPIKKVLKVINLDDYEHGAEHN